MSYILDSTILRNPMKFTETPVDQYSQVRTLANTLGRDYFGAVGKRIWVLDYINTTTAEYAVISAIRDSFRATATAKSWEVTEGNYIVSSTLVMVDLAPRVFSIGGTTYLSDFSISLSEI